MDGISSTITNNISAIIMALIFLWYLNKRDKMVQDTFDNFAGKLEKLTDALTSLELRFQDIRRK